MSEHLYYLLTGGHVWILILEIVVIVAYIAYLLLKFILRIFGTDEYNEW